MLGALSTGPHSQLSREAHGDNMFTIWMRRPLAAVYLSYTEMTVLCSWSG
jgi:hypothetical protein